jgi:hypothetical protein
VKCALTICGYVAEQINGVTKKGVFLFQLDSILNRAVMYKTYSGPSQKKDASSRDFSHTFPLNASARNMSEEEQKQEQERLMMEIQYLMSDEIFDDVVITPTPSDNVSFIIIIIIIFIIIISFE